METELYRKTDERNQMLPQFDEKRSTSPLDDTELHNRLADPGFGRYFTEHMVTMKWSPDKCWHQGEVKPYQPFAADPAMAALHYGQEIFEGMKAYRSRNGELLLFRPELNARRFAKSAERLAMPVLPEDIFLEAIERLVLIDERWVPQAEGGSLYLRPFMFASEAMLGVKPAREYTFCIIASPVGAYFKGGTAPVRIWVSRDYTRAAVGGTGEAKCAGNYAGSLIAQIQAAEQGCDQSLFLDAAEGRWIEELGGMNVCFVTADGRLRTSPLGGTILRGITRDAILTLAQQEGLSIDEAPYAFEDMRADALAGRTVEAFACGTAAVIAPIGSFRDGDDEFAISGGVAGAITQRLRNRLVGIQRGDEHDEHGWMHKIGTNSKGN